MCGVPVAPRANQALQFRGGPGETRRLVPTKTEEGGPFLSRPALRVPETRVHRLHYHCHHLQQSVYSTRAVCAFGLLNLLNLNTVDSNLRGSRPGHCVGSGVSPAVVDSSPGENENPMIPTYEMGCESTSVLCSHKLK